MWPLGHLVVVAYSVLVGPESPRCEFRIRSVLATLACNHSEDGSEALHVCFDLIVLALFQDM